MEDPRQSYLQIDSLSAFVVVESCWFRVSLGRVNRLCAHVMVDVGRAL